MPEQHYISVKSSNLAIRAGLNGMPIVSDRGGTGIVITEPVNVWLKPDANTLSVWLSGSPGQPGLGVGSAEVSVFVHDPREELPTPALVLATFSWPPEASPGDQAVFVSDEPLMTQPRETPPLRLWSEAPQLAEPTQAERDEMLALVEDLREAAAEQDTEGILRLLRYRYQEEAAAEGRPVIRIEENVTSLWNWLFGLEGRMETIALPPVQARFEMVADHRAVLITREDGTDALLIEKPQAELGFGVRIVMARILDNWTIVR